MISVYEARRGSSPQPFDREPLALDSGFGGLDGDALDLVERRYSDRGLAVTRERYSSRNESGDVVCTATSSSTNNGTP